MKKLAALVLLFLLFAKPTFAQTIAVPSPAPIDCSKTDNPEYNSLRPYQASPCGDAPKTYFCGNKLIVGIGTVTTTPCGSSVCPCVSSSCHVRNRKIIIDLTDVELPILGNTELVKNSQNAAESLDDAQKMNEYVSWYLNGTTDKAEYGPTDLAKVVDYSGPVNKLLPQAIQEAQRIESIKNTFTKTTTVDEETGEKVTGPENHDQIVVCTQGNQPIECYKGDGSRTQGKEYRLNDWNDGSLSLFNTFLNWLGSEIWNKKYPPLPWQFKDSQLYQKAYFEWRGKSCTILPLVGLVCIDNPLVVNKWADLFPYIPLANTTDKKSAEMVKNIHVSAPKARVASSDYKIITNFALYFPHTAEDFELSATLNKTYTPQKGSGGEASSASFEINDAETCRLIETRANPGDDLTFNKPPSTMEATVDYDISEVDCELKRTCKYDWDLQKQVCENEWTCQSEVLATVNLLTKTPYADEIWKNTTVGANAVFRRIFPKVEEGAPVSCIADIPAASKATYTTGAGSEGKLQKVQNPGDSAASSPEIYFSHFGSVYEYFLKGIQTALRPQGYGEPLTNGTECSTTECGELPDLPKASGSCSLGGVSSRVGNIPQSLKNIISAAAETYKTPPNLILGIMYGEGLFDGKNKKDWTDQNVKNWATCTAVPGCSTSGDDNFMGFFSSDWDNIKDKIYPDLKKLDPNRKKPSQCNLLDAVYGLAWNLHDSGDGGMSFKCFGIDLKASVPTSCTWNNEQYESAIKVHESGYTDMCLTKEGSCATGGGTDATCPAGDTCETISSRYSNPSHNGCVWDTAHGH
jgi:hypothetical protein